MSAHESSHRFVLGVLLLAVVAVLGVSYTYKSEGNTPALINTSGSQNDSAPEALDDSDPSDLREDPQEDPQRTLSEPDPTPPTAPKEVLICRRADNREPLAGISLYQNGVVRIGPTKSDGKLLIGDLGWDSRTLWGQGWTAQRLRGAHVPAEVLFASADSKFDIALKNASPQHKVIRSILQMRGAGAPPEGPWSPKLQVANWDRLAANGVPPGTYDIYVWISENMGTPEPYEFQSIELKPGQFRQLSIDLITDKQDTTEDDITISSTQRHLPQRHL